MILRGSDYEKSLDAYYKDHAEPVKQRLGKLLLNPSTPVDHKEIMRVKNEFFALLDAIINALQKVPASISIEDTDYLYSLIFDLKTAKATLISTVEHLHNQLTVWFPEDAEPHPLSGQHPHTENKEFLHTFFSGSTTVKPEVVNSLFGMRIMN